MEQNSIKLVQAQSELWSHKVWEFHKHKFGIFWLYKQGHLQFFGKGNNKGIHSLPGACHIVIDYPAPYNTNLPYVQAGPTDNQDTNQTSLTTRIMCMQLKRTPSIHSDLWMVNKGFNMVRMLKICQFWQNMLNTGPNKPSKV